MPARRNANAGFTLLEVLIAVLVLAIGMLGIAAMQATSLKNSQGSLERSQAVVASYGILDAMRANALVARGGNYNMAVSCTAPTATGSLVASDQNAWITALQANMGGSACGGINCAANVCEITVRWDDQRSTGGSTAQELKLRSRI